jgi:6-phosphogluconolactonase (cycloisomerase 2 family)
MLLVVTAMVAVLFLAGCGKGGCNQPTLTTTATGSSSAGVATNSTCGGGSGGGPVAAYAFYLGSGVQTADFSTNGTFTALTNITAPALAGTAIDDMTTVSGKYLYLPFGDVNSVVQGLAINHTTGALTPIPGSPFALTAGATADTAVADPQGRFLFAGAEGTGSISVFQIGSNGALTQAPGSPFTDPVKLFSADSIAVDGLGKFLYAGQLDFSTPLDGFTIDQTTGALTEITGAPFNLGVAQLHADSSGKFLLGVQEIQDFNGAATDQHIYVFSIDPTTGVPTPVVGSPFATTSAPFDFVISPNGKFVYVTGNDPVALTISPIEGYQLDSTTGALTPLANSPFTALPAATQCKFDQSGGLMFCATNSQGALSVFSANTSTGAIAHLVDLSAFSYPFAITD